MLTQKRPRTLSSARVSYPHHLRLPSLPTCRDTQRPRWSSPPGFLPPRSILVEHLGVMI
jgi:hypothetical protein